ncbi:MAG: hypothetical protein MZU79_01020 [Anaerotruncus sp.]|nr:hypothetical protein [Anaerotruncus sp.]
MVSEVTISKNRIFNLSGADGSQLRGIYLRRLLRRSRSTGSSPSRITRSRSRRRAAGSRRSTGCMRNGNGRGHGLRRTYNSIFVGGVRKRGHGTHPAFYRHSSFRKPWLQQAAEQPYCQSRGEPAGGGTGQKYAVFAEYKNLFDADYNFLSGSGSTGSN